MLFNSFEFLLFFPVVTAGYFFIVPQWRWAWLLVASCFFYMYFKPIYILILAFTIVIDYWAGILIEDAAGAKRRFYLAWSLTANIAVLAVFKYFNFLNNNVTTAVSIFGFHNPVPNLSILLPIGLSFHTFQAMSYTIEVYRGHQKAERHFGIYSLYVMFYPQLVAGPIERPQNLLHQFREHHRFDPEDATVGFAMIASGLFRKMVVADRLALYVDTIYKDIPGSSGVSVLFALILYSFQIYCDFSGYSEIALGTARVMGIRLMRNFDRPFLAQTVVEYWSRWHISLSTWFRDYLYTPITSANPERWAFGLIVVFLVSGLWHGASWNFVVWGALHGVFMLGTILLAEPAALAVHASGLARFPNVMRWARTGLTFALVTIAFIFFRAQTFHDAGLLLQKVVSLSFGMPSPFGALMKACLALALLFTAESLTRGDIEKLRRKDAFIAVVIYLILMLRVPSEQQFIYFRF